jgi:hypothetical protein
MDFAGSPSRMGKLPETLLLDIVTGRGKTFHLAPFERPNHGSQPLPSDSRADKRPPDSVYNSPMLIEFHSLQDGMGPIWMCRGVTGRELIAKNGARPQLKRL